MKIVKYKVIGSLQDNYVENDYWDEYKLFIIGLLIHYFK